MKTAIFPGSFDPITIGHVDIIKRSVGLFDKLIVAIGVNHRKKYQFSLEQRMKWIEGLFEDDNRIQVDTYTGLTVKFCAEVGANHIIRGIRSAADFEYEKVIAQVNRDVSGTDLETLLILSRPEYSHISSTVVKEIILGDGQWASFVPDLVRKEIKSSS
ncbi:MAG: pantetheine-phosphate adenylyltransferase [Limisphaerales bacterium]